jgi:hypothetical protein
MFTKKPIGISFCARRRSEEGDALRPPGDVGPWSLPVSMSIAA